MYSTVFDLLYDLILNSANFQLGCFSFSFLDSIFKSIYYIIHLLLISSKNGKYLIINHSVSTKIMEN